MLASTLTFIIAFLCLTEASVVIINRNLTQRELNRGPVSFETKVETLEVDGGWKTFQFTVADVPALTSYEFSCDSCILQIVDLYCTGDRFDFLDNGMLYNVTYRGVREVICLGEDNPDLAVLDSDYSQTFGILYPGSHNISIIPVRSPSNGGTAAIRLSSWLPY